MAGIIVSPTWRERWFEGSCHEVVT